MIKTYHVKHRKGILFQPMLKNALKVAQYAIKNKTKYPSSKDVKDIDLPSVIKNQIMRKYGRGNAKKVSNINLIVPNMKTKTKKKTYETITYTNGIVEIKPLKISFRWNPGISFNEIKQIEISLERFMISATFPISKKKLRFGKKNYLGIDLNCGGGRHIANCANLKTKEVLNLGKSGPNLRKKFQNKRKKGEVNKRKERRTLRDLDHKVSRAIVNYALKNKLKIILEDLKNIRKKSKKGTGSKNKNRVINSWSFYRLQTYITYKAEEYNIPVFKIQPHYTSQECSYCSVIGVRKKESFFCKNKKCSKFKIKRHSDVNASFNIAKRAYNLRF